MAPSTKETTKSMTDFFSNPDLVKKMSTQKAEQKIISKYEMPRLQVNLSKDIPTVFRQQPTNNIPRDALTEQKFTTPTKPIVKPKFSTPSTQTKKMSTPIHSTYYHYPRQPLKLEYNDDYIVEQIVEFNPENSYIVCDECKNRYNDRRTLKDHKKIAHTA